MSRKYINKLLILLISFSLFGCKDFIEKNISEETPVLILPANNDTIGANPVHIKWEELTGATKYKIEIVSPAFSNIQSFPLDSIVSGTNFYFGLDSAQYEIRITAMNAGFSSNPSEIKRFWVGTSQGGSNAGVVLTSPVVEEYVNGDFDGKFSWNTSALGSIESCAFELHRGTTFAGELLDPIDQINSAYVYSLNGSELTEDTYCWGVKAYFVGGETNYSKRIFYVDKTAPGMGTPSTPNDNENVSSGSITFTWSLPPDVGTIKSPVGGRVELSTFNNFASIYKTGTGTSTSVAITSVAPGTYYWRVILVDEAGNEGAVPGTMPRTITVL